jgi:hypothetical protein
LFDEKVDVVDGGVAKWVEDALSGATEIIAASSKKGGQASSYLAGKDEEGGLGRFR